MGEASASGATLFYDGSVLTTRDLPRSDPMGVSKVRVRGRQMWRARVRQGDRVKTAYRRRRDEAVEAERELRDELAREQRPQPAAKEVSNEVPLFKDFAEQCMTTYFAVENRPRTFREKQRMLKRSLLPIFGDMRVDEIGGREVAEFKATRRATKTRQGTPLTPKTVNEELSLLSKILKLAHEWEVIDRLPPLKRLRQPPTKFDFLDFDEAERLIAAAKHATSPWNAMVPIACWTGLRLSELRGLKWDDVDLVARRIHVQRAADDRCDLYPPKSHRVRYVDLPDKAVAVLKEHRHLRGDFVFCRDDGSILPTHDCESKSKAEKDDSPVMKLCRKAGLRRVGWHVLRHTYASHLVMLGASLMQVKELLGHSSINTTMRYAHLSPTSRRAAVDLLDQRDQGGDAGGDSVGQANETASNATLKTVS